MRGFLVVLLVASACASGANVPAESRRDAGTSEEPVDAGTPENPLVPDAGEVDAPDAGPTRPPPEPVPPRALLELVPLDIWGRDLDAEVLVDRFLPEREEPAAGPGVRVLPLPPVSYTIQVRVEARDHLPTSLEVRFDGGSTASAFSTTAPTGTARSVAAFTTRLVDGRMLPVYTLFIGLDHAWFAASGAVPSRNRLELLLDGEESFRAVDTAVRAATDRVTWATWWWQSDFELVRPSNHLTLSPSQRRSNTALALAESRPNTRWHLLVNRFWGENADFLSSLNTDTALRNHATSRTGNVELIVQGNETEVPVQGHYAGRAPGFRFGPRVRLNPRYADARILAPDAEGPAYPFAVQAASWHQKSVVVDGRVGFVLGLNTKADDWDTPAHAVFEPKRMPFTATTAEREAVAAKEAEPEFEPRKDYGLRVEGPLVADLEGAFLSRWDDARGSGALFSDATTEVQRRPPPPEPSDGVQSQLVLTTPEPSAEMSLLETHAKAIAQANELVFIEDQFFRAPIINEKLVARMQANPRLHLVVVTADVAASDPGKKFTYLSDALFRRLFPTRYLLLQLRSVDHRIDEGFFFDDVEFEDVPVFVHSKLRVVDDLYYSVGSCNMNNRGYLYEGELNVSAFDREATRRVRQRVFENMLGTATAARLTGDGANDLRVFKEAAARNEGIRQWWVENASSLDVDDVDAERARRWPTGFVYPLRIEGDYWFDPGPDLF